MIIEKIKIIYREALKVGNFFKIARCSQCNEKDSLRLQGTADLCSTYINSDGKVAVAVAVHHNIDNSVEALFIRIHSIVVATKYMRAECFLGRKELFFVVKK